ncbi:MAG: class I SAM-dependent methyltransferase [Bacillota bacterium]|nr:class I SAM-dependent methyltransferase [Bacillota bacterium]
MESNNSGQDIKEQYKTAEKLNARSRLHSYNINKTDWNNWCFNQMQIPHKARILELGCGTGDFWHKNIHCLKSDWDIILSDFSKGMLENTKNRLEKSDFNFKYEEIDAQEIPYENEYFDVIIARHMLYLIPDIEKALLEIKRVLTECGIFYATTNSHDSMAELNKLVEEFDPKLELNNNGMGDRFDMEGGYLLLKKYFGKVKMDVLQGKIIVNDAEPIVAYKASTIKGSSLLTGDKKQQFAKFVEDYIKKNGSISITTKSCIFKAEK